MKERKALLDLAHSQTIVPLLPVCVYELFALRGERVTLASSKLLTHAREKPQYAHFLLSGAASLTTTLRDGRCIQASLLGPGCLDEAYQILGPAPVFIEATMELAGAALQVPYTELQSACRESRALQRFIAKQIQTNGLVASQLVACSTYHELQARFASLLLLLSEHAGGHSFHVTQEALAAMLGVRRTTLTLTASGLQRRNLIHYNRGHIEISDREQLSKVACECCDVIRTINSHLRLP